MRVGIYGGTFDPVHFGHLVLAEQCREQGNLDQVWFIPAPRPPSKLDQPLTRFDQRVEMLELAIAGNTAFQIDEIEKERTGLSYTVDTLEDLHARHPGVEFSLLLGGDSLADLPNWKNIKRILQLVKVLVMPRPGTPTLSEGELRARLGWDANEPLSLHIIEAPMIDIASHELRQRAEQGRSVRYLVPRAVEVYLWEKKLYRPK